MQQIDLQKSKYFFGIKAIKRMSGIEYQDYCNLTSDNLPLGEMLLTTLECTDILYDVALINSRDISEENKILLSRKILVEHFCKCQYNFTNFYLSLHNKITVTDINRIKMIKTYVEQCIEKTKSLNLKSLKELAYSILKASSGKSTALKIFNAKDQNRNVKLNHTKIQIDEQDFTSKMIKHFSNQFYEFTLLSYTSFERLSELCIIALYEIANLELYILKCKMCGKYFLGSSSAKICNRKASENDYRGCRTYRTYLATQKINEYEYIKLYKVIYARLQYRIRNKQVKDIENFNLFKNEWKKLKADKSKTENDYIEFLSDERWK